MSAAAVKKAYISLGSNLGNRPANLKQALELIASEESIAVSAISGLYETDPVGGPEQGPFLNACALLATVVTPTMLLSKLLSIENIIGRVREERWGPRVIDLDLLLYEGVTMNTPLLQLPHPRMAERNFVLIPLADIAPTLMISEELGTISKLIEENTATGKVRRFSAENWPKTLK